MSLEDKIVALTAALEANTAALSGKKSSAASSDDGVAEPKTTRAGKKAADDKPATKYTAEQVKAAAVKVKGELGTKAAKQLIKDHGADELAEMKPDQYEAFLKACEKALTGEDPGEEGDL